MYFLSKSLNRQNKIKIDMSVCVEDREYNNYHPEFIFIYLCVFFLQDRALSCSLSWNYKHVPPHWLENFKLNEQGRTIISADEYV